MTFHFQNRWLPAPISWRKNQSHHIVVSEVFLENIVFDNNNLKLKMGDKIYTLSCFFSYLVSYYYKL